MEIKEFIELFANTIEVDDVQALSPETEFRELDEWSSLTYLMVIVFMDEQFGVQVEPSEFKKMRTIQDLYNACIKQ